MRRYLDVCVICLAALAEPVCHALGIPHPEGLAQLAVNALACRQT